MTFRPAAIVGMGCRIAGAAGLDALWARATDGAAPFAPVPALRFDREALAAELPAGAGPLRAALVESVPLDWRALRLPPQQAERLHLGEKLALQTMAEAIADAGLRPGGPPVERGRIFIAATTLGSDPHIDPMRRIRRRRLAAPIAEALGQIAPAEEAAALAMLDRLVDLASPPIEPDSLFTSASIVAGRATNLYDFRGGHCAIDVGTASSLAAVAEALDALSRGDCDLAVVCAVAPLVTPSALLALAHRGELGSAPPRPFDPSAAGTLLGEGAAAVVLKRADDAASDRVYAVLEGVASAAEPGAREPAALSRCVARAAADALARAGARPEAVAAVASRAAGLACDAAEAEGLARAYRGRAEPLPVASCVPATGFLQGATGLVALVQAALALHRGAWPGPPRAPTPCGPGLAAAGPAPLPGDLRVAVSDAGPEPVAYHAVLGPRRAAQPSAASALAPRARGAAPGGRGDAEAFAVVGLGLVVPGANDVEGYWRNVLRGDDPIRDLPRSRFDVDALVGDDAELAHALRTRLAATVSPPPFEPGRYGLADDEADGLDPAIPLALLAAEQAFRDAGLDRAPPGRRGQAVFGQLSLRVREAGNDARIAFGGMLALTGEALVELALPPEKVRAALARARELFDARGQARWREALRATTGYALTERVAAAFGLGGVPLTVDAACASSLAAVLAGCQALSRGEADVVLAGGVAHNLLPEYYVGLGLLGALSTRGGLPFHAEADGFVPAEGAGAVVLKRLADARSAGDRIYAIVRGHGVSSDGRGLSIYSPSTAGQQLALRRALEQAGVEPETVDLVETHGPGTHLGDRTEIASYAAVYGVPRPAPLVLSASKSQVGHTTSAAGMIAFVRAALALHRRVLPPTNVSGELDPELRLDGIPATFATEATSWAGPPGGLRRAAVSAFGMAGANHHVLLEEAPDRAAAEASAVAPPPSGLEADRFVIDLAPVALPDRAPRLPLAGRRAAVFGAPGGPAAAVAAALRARGVLATCVPAGGAPDREADVFVDVGAFGPCPGLLDAGAAALASRARDGALRAISAVRAAHERLAASTPDRPAVLVAVTAMGGDLGLSGSGAGNVLGAFQHGLALALKQELPAALVKAIDLDALAPPDVVAELLLREVEDGNERVLVGYAGRRFVPNLRRAPHAPGAAPLREIRRGDVFLFSGGGRGVVFECACAVARLGATAVVTGRTRLADSGAPHLALDDDGFAQFRRQEIVRRRGEPGLTPARFEREMEPLVRERELHRNLARARAEGLALEYEPCDVADAASVHAVVERVRARHGHLDFLGHGAMVERSAGVMSKTDEDVVRTLDAKVVGLLNLLDATRDDPLRAIVAFGSGVARFGNRGQTDYAGANALLAALLPALAARRPRPVHAVTVDWPAWREVGWAAANRDVAAGLDAMGVTSISPLEGRCWFMAELLHGTAGEVLLVSERMLHAWPYLGASADGARPCGPTDDRAALLVPGAHPLLDGVHEREPHRLVATRRLDAERDPFLAQHLVAGRPVLPAAFAVELLAEAAALLHPDARVAEVTDFRIEIPLAVPRRFLEVRAEVRAAGETPGTVLASLVTRLAIAAPGGRDRIHATARVRLSPGVEPPRAGAPIPEGEGRVRARSFYRFSRDPVALGPLFCRARWLEVADGEARATIEPPDLRRALAGTRHPVFRVDPLLLDSAFQIAGSVEGYAGGWVCVPVAAASVRPGRPPRRDERTRARAVLVREAPPSAFYDVRVAGEDGAVLLEVDGLELRRVAAAVDAA